MSDGDDIDARFDELVAQFGERDVKRLRREAGRGARSARPRGRSGAPRRSRGAVREYDRVAAGRSPHSRRKVWLAVWLVIALIAAAGTVVTADPDLLTPKAAPTRTPGPAATVTAAPPSPGGA
ncbi:hypothetical protein [Nonomuraea sp. NPDC050310]|uniref:hypothetical protein n=1 Tax=Nonomuraea sp. NPDC050310 TaxID=3154935 RepID=UPI0033EAC4B6